MVNSLKWSSIDECRQGCRVNNEDQECAGGPRGGRGEPVTQAIWAEGIERMAWANTLMVSKLITKGDGGALTCVQRGQSIVPDGLIVSPEPSSKFTIFMPPVAEQTIWLAWGFTNGDATETPTNSTNQTNTKRARSWVLRRVCMCLIVSQVSFLNLRRWIYWFQKDNTNCLVTRHLMTTTPHKHSLHAESNLEQRFLRSREKSDIQPNRQGHKLYSKVLTFEPNRLLKNSCSAKSN